MRTLLTIFLFSNLFLLTAQEIEVEILRMENDSVYSKATVLSLDGKIAEVRYLRTLADQRTKSKPDLYLDGKNPSSKLFSLLQYSYGVDWTLSRVDTFYERKFIYDYASNEIELYGDFQFLEGRAHTKHEVEFGIRNGTPQDYKVKYGFDNDALNNPTKEQLLRNRIKEKFSADLLIEPGRHEYQLLVKNSNGVKRKAAIEAIGYDIIDQDFVESSKKSGCRKIKLKGKKELYVEVKGNYKLLSISNKREEHRIPVSKVLNVIDSDYLRKGKNTLELTNLNTGEIKLCKLKIR